MFTAFWGEQRVTVAIVAVACIFFRDTPIERQVARFDEVG